MFIWLGSSTTPPPLPSVSSTGGIQEDWERGQLAGRRGGWVGEKPKTYGRKKAWSSTNHSILSPFFILYVGHVAGPVSLPERLKYLAYNFFCNECNRARLLPLEQRHLLGHLKDFSRQPLSISWSSPARQGKISFPYTFRVNGTITRISSQILLNKNILDIEQLYNNLRARHVRV